MTMELEKRLREKFQVDSTNLGEPYYEEIPECIEAADALADNRTTIAALTAKLAEVEREAANRIEVMTKSRSEYLARATAAESDNARLTHALNTALEEGMAAMASVADVTKERDAARQALEHDRAKVIAACNSFNDAFARRSWLLDSRGPYEWDDDRYRDEFRQAYDELAAPMMTLTTIGKDWTNCPTNHDEIMRSRQNWEARATAAEARSAVLAVTLDFVAKMAWRTDPPNANNKLTDAERLSAIKFHPSIKKLAQPHIELAETEARAALASGQATGGGDEAQRQSGARGLSAGCEHGNADFEQCPRCRRHD